MTKISDTSALTGASVDAANDLVPVVDMSEVGAARNKKMTFAEFLIGLGSYRPGGTDVAVADGGTGASTASAARTNLASAAASQTGEQISGFISTPSNKSYTIALDMKHAGTITEVTTKSASGTCTATWKINSTALGGTANSVSSTETTQSHASANVFAAGDDIVLTVSSNSSCADMSFTIKYTRTLA